jgi:biopolymer transport protein ExbD
MQIRRRHREGAEVETSSLNDIMFFLLLFFLIASTMANPNVINVLLPKVSKTDQNVSPKSIQLTVTADKKVYIFQEEILYEELDGRLSKLKAEFESPDSKNAGIVVVLRLDRDLKVQDMVDVMQVGANLGVRMVLATDKQTK